MVAYTRDEIISATDLARNVSGTLSSIVKHTKEKVAISKNNKLEAVIINIEEYERLKEAYDLMEKMFEENVKKYDYHKEVLKYTYPIFIRESAISRPELVGSSIIISLDKKTYLVTACHVYKRHIKEKGSFYIGVEKGENIISVDGDIIALDNEKIFDIAFIELNEEFIKTNSIMAFDVHDNSIADKNTERYFGMLCGFPVSANMNHPKKAWVKDNQKYRGKPYWYTNIIAPDKENDNIVMSYGKNIKNEQPKKLNGMSGCGMWACHIATEKLQLAGIFIEHHKNREDTLHAIPIEEVAKFIRKGV